MIESFKADPKHMDRIQAVLDLVSTFRMDKTPAHDVALALIVLEDATFALQMGLSLGLTLDKIREGVRSIYEAKP